MDPHALLSLIALTFAAAWTPGPNNAMLASSGVTYGIRRTVPHALGVAIGFPVMAMTVGLVLGEVFKASAFLREAMRWISAALLLWVAWKIANSGKVGSVSRLSRPFRFHEAAAFQWVNPKGWVVSIAVTAQFVNPAHPIQTAIIVTLVFLVSGFTSAFGWASMGSALRRLLGDGLRLHVFNIAMALIIASGVVLLFLH